MGKIAQDLDTFRMPVDLKIETEGNPEQKRVEVVGTSSEFSVDTFGKPKNIVIDPDNRVLRYSPQVRVAVAIKRGEQFAELSEFADALKEYQKALETTRNSSLAHYRIAEVYFLQQNWQPAANEFREALNGDEEPKWTVVWAHINLGKIFDVTFNRPAPAIYMGFTVGRHIFVEATLRIQLSDKTSRLRPRIVASNTGQTYKTHGLVDVRGWIVPVATSSDFVFVSQPPTQPRHCVDINCPIRFIDGAYVKVVRPSSQRSVQLIHQCRGILPCCRFSSHRMNFIDHALDAFLRRSVAQICLPRARRINATKCVSQKVELAFRYLADSCFLLVDRQLQFPHDFAQPE